MHHRKCGKIFFVTDLLGEMFFFYYTREPMNNGVSPFSFSYCDVFCFSIWNFIFVVCRPFSIGFHFLGPRGSLWAIWNIIKEQGSHELDIRLWGTKGLSERPMCIRPKCSNPFTNLFYSVLFYTLVCLFHGWPYLPWQEVTTHAVLAILFSDSGSNVKSKIGFYHVLAVLFKTIFHRPS